MTAVRTLAKTFTVTAVWPDEQRHQTDVTLTWADEVAMEMRLHIWVPGDSDDSTVIWSVSRDLLIEVCAGVDGIGHGTGDITAVKMGGLVLLWLESDSGRICLMFKAAPLTAFVHTSLAMCPPESEAVDVDGLIHKIFHAEEAQ